MFPPTRLLLAAVVTGLTLYNGAVIAELVRWDRRTAQGSVRGGPVGGADSVADAARILLPAGVTAMLPALVGQFVVVLKDSALGYVITYEELLNKANQIGTSQQNIVPAFLVVAVIFIVINYGLTKLAGLLERRLNRRGRTAGGAVPGAPGQKPVDLMRINTETG